MAWEENSRICLHMQLIAILSRTGVYSANRVIFQLISQPDTGFTHKLLRVAVDSVYD